MLGDASRSPTGRPTCAGTSRTRARRYLSRAFVTGGLRLLPHDAARREGAAAALEALRAAAWTATSARRSARSSWRRPSRPRRRRRRSRWRRHVEEAMADEIRALDWMSDADQGAALEKLARDRQQDRLPGRVARLLRRSRSRAATSSATCARATIFESRRQLAKIGKPVDRGEWGMTPPTVNAYYNPQMNDINFPAGVLQPPLFDPKMDDAPNYGNTGAHHRPRADPRLRRRGPPVRREGQPQGLVDEGGRGGVRGARAVRRRPVRAVHDRRRHQDQQQAHARARTSPTSAGRCSPTWRGRRRPRARRSSRATASRPSSASSSASRSGPARTTRPENLRVSARHQSALARPLPRSTASSSNMPEFAAGVLLQGRASRWSRENRCRIW